MRGTALVPADDLAIHDREANLDGKAAGVEATQLGDRSRLMRERDLGLDLPDMALVRPTDQPLHGLDHVSLLALDLTDQRLGRTRPADVRVHRTGEPVVVVLVLLLDHAWQERGRADQVPGVVPLSNQTVLDRLTRLGNLLQPAWH